MTTNLKAANDFIRFLQEQRAAYQNFAEQKIVPLFLDNDQQERRPPRHFKDSSYLYIRSYDSDTGSRPFANQVFWLSPDISVSPISNLGAYTRTLNAGETYNIRCLLRNRGDLAVPSAKVELWLVDPSLGFDTRFAKNLTLGQVPSAWVNANSLSEVNFTYMVPPTEAGHKCLFARTFSFAPSELPIDDFKLDPTIDRHVAQLNLNIVQQGESFQFNWLHAPNTRQLIQFTPMERDEVFMLRHPVLADVLPNADFPREGWVQMTQISLSETEAREIEISQDHNGLKIETKDPEGFDLVTQHEIRFTLKQVLAAIEAGETHLAEHRDLLTKFREMNRQTQRTTFKMQIPDLGLREGQTIGVHIRAVDAFDNADNEVLGGVTLLILA